MSAYRRVFLRARWHWLAMMNFEVEPTLLAPHVPRGTELDTWRGAALASVVGFRFLDTRVWGLPIPFHRNFDEVNLRFYVCREVDGELRRGVVFIKEIVPRRAIAWVARTVYGENYVALPMRHQVPTDAPTAGSVPVCYGWRHEGRWHDMRVQIQGSPKTPADDEEATFITEHYWGYARQRDTSTVEYQVEHPRWRVWDATEARLEADVSTLYGAGFAEALAGPPRSAFVADGSDVVVRRGARLS